MSEAVTAPRTAELGDWIALLKPRVMTLVVFTGLIGLLIAPGHLHPVLAFTAVLCIAVAAGACGAINMWYDRDIDAVMRRTRNRPIPAGRIEPGAALGFGVTLAVGSVHHDGAGGEPRGRVGAGAVDRLLCVRLYDVAEAADAAEHRDRRRGGRISAGDRLGGGDRIGRSDAAGAVRHRVLLDAAAFLVAGAVRQCRLPACRRADAAGGRWRQGDAAADRDLHAAAGAAVAGAVADRLLRLGLWPRGTGARRRVPGRGLARGCRPAGCARASA